VEYTCSPDPGGWFKSWSGSDSVFTLLHNPLEIGTSYTFEITSGMDEVGNNLTSGPVPISWEFSTISVASLIITPSEASIPVNGTVGLIAWAYDSQDNLVSDITFTWGVDNNLGTVSPQGKQAVTFSASSIEGTSVVTVEAGTLSASATVTITKEVIEEVDPQEEDPEDLLWLWFLILVIIILFAINLWIGLRKQKPEMPEEMLPTEEKEPESFDEEETPAINEETPIDDIEGEREESIGEPDLEDQPNKKSAE
jgi:hypothetical protein